MAEATNSDYDYLSLQNDRNIIKMLQKIGDNYPKLETVEFSTELLKINRKGKEQKRILLFTNKAIYNIKPNKRRACKRRILLDSVASITSSLRSHELTINIPSEYDYRYKALTNEQKNDIISTLQCLYGHRTAMNLNLHQISEVTTLHYTVTKLQSKLIVCPMIHLIQKTQHTRAHILKTQQEKYQRRYNLTSSSNVIFDATKE
eukprot:23472_1